MTIIAPPFNLESATKKVRLAEDGWNSRDPGKVSLALRRTAVGGTAPNSWRLAAMDPVENTAPFSIAAAALLPSRLPGD